MFVREGHSESSPGIHPWVRTLELSGLLLVAGWVFAECWNHPFHFDDSLFLQSPQVTDPGDPWYMLRPSQSRPLTYLTFYANYRFGGVNPRGYHLVNWMIHLTNVALVYGFVLLLSWRFPGTTAGRLGRWLPLIAAGVFALHPVQSEAVNYVYQRSTLLATLFVLASFLTFLWSERINRPWLAYPWGRRLLASGCGGQRIGPCPSTGICRLSMGTQSGSAFAEAVHRQSPRTTDFHDRARGGWCGLVALQSSGL